MEICKRNGSKFSPRGAVCFSSNQGKTLTLVTSQHTRVGISRLAEIRKSNGGEGTQPGMCVRVFYTWQIESRRFHPETCGTDAQQTSSVNPIIRFMCEWAPIQTKRPKPHYACFSPKHGPVNSPGHPFFYLLKEKNGFEDFF